MLRSDALAATALDQATTELARDTNDRDGEVRRYFAQHEPLWILLAMSVHRQFLSSASSDGDEQAQKAYESFRTQVFETLDDADVRTWMEEKAAFILRMARYLLEQVEKLYQSSSAAFPKKLAQQAEIADLARSLLAMAKPEDVLAVIKLRLESAKTKEQRATLERLAEIVLDALEKPACGCKHPPDEKKKTSRA